MRRSWMVFNMKTLAFDTSTKFLSIALLEDRRVVSSFHEDAGVRHSGILIPTIKDMLEREAWRAGDIELVCVGLGPGSFTGLRIAMGTVKGLAIVLGSRVMGVPTMDAIALSPAARKAEGSRIAPLLDAHKEKVYTCIYDRSGGTVERSTDYLLTEVDDFLETLDKEVFFFGSGVPKYKEKLDSSRLASYSLETDWYPRAVDIATLGLERSVRGTADPETIDPLYLHSKECNIIKRK